MRIQTSSFQSKVARRLFFSFIACALVPIAALAGLTLYQLGSHLEQQNDHRLHSAAKALGMSLFERLGYLDSELRSAAQNLRMPPRSGNQAEAINHGLRKHFSALSLLSQDEAVVSILGQTFDPPALTAAQRRHLQQGKTLLHSGSSQKNMLLLRSLTAEGNTLLPLLYARIRKDFLWKPLSRELLPPQREVCIANSQGQILHTTFTDPPPLAEPSIQRLKAESSGSFELQLEETAYESHFWSLFLKYHFLTDKWVILLHTSKAYLFAPFRQFTIILALTSGLALLVVLLLSSRKIRDQLVPLEKLNKATKRVAAGNFNTAVVLQQDDEFAELASSFNWMTQRLGRQFQTISLTDEIVRSVLSSLNTQSVIAIVLDKLPELIACRDVGVFLLESRQTSQGRLFMKGGQLGAEPATITLTPTEMEILNHGRAWHMLEPAQPDQNQLPHFILEGAGRTCLLPLDHQHGVTGFLILSIDQSSDISDDDLQQARHVADQIAVALSNARLLEQLDAFSWGTLYALARAIDIKSPWTAGHSERVTQMALQIGRRMGLDEEELDNMHRGGLLHDIGKLGVPSAILDKPGKLTKDEYRQVCEHTRMGARILEPLPAFSKAVTIVRHHHEQFDGKGYPDGLAGEEIEVACRIFAVADNYDALVSDRPYRPALDQETVISYIKGEAGKKFDPAVVEAFLEVMDSPPLSDEAGVHHESRREHG